MLKYTLNTGELISDIQRIKPIYTRVDDYGFEEYFVVTIMHDGTHSFERGEMVDIEHFMNIDSGTHRDSIQSELSIGYEVQSCDNNAHIMTINTPKLYPLELDAVSFPFPLTDNRTLIFTLKENHHFSFGDECVLIVNGVSITCEFSDEKNLVWQYDTNNVEHAEILNTIFPSETYYQVGADETVVSYSVLAFLPNPVLFTSPEYVKIAQQGSNADSGLVYRKSVGQPVIEKLSVFRPTFLFGNEDRITILANNPSFSINIPLQQAFDTKTNRDWILNENFSKEQADAMVTAPTSVEKDTYHPVLIDEYGNAHFAKKIKINLHFRKRDLSNGWANPNDDDFWNGTDDTDPDYPLRSRAAYFSQITGAYSEFIDNRSDLLSKIGFTDTDVKYQYEKLKKSFLRLSYFTSTNPATQLLVGYSTIFFDTGKLLSKYIKHSHDDGYYKPLQDNSGQNYISYPGEPISVKNEAFDDSIFHTANEFEELRLSTQFVVSDRFSSTASSEGFYIYIYKDYSSELPKDLYMRVEFNHAGYGKKIPFFMPSKIQSVNQTRGIKTYEEILEDWQTPNEGYGFDLFNAYSYIHLKYRYDFDTKKHIYYIDDEYYGVGVLYPREEEVTNEEERKEITINLYEVKVKL